MDCKDDFAIYELMLKSIEAGDFKLMEAPVDFEKRVMTRVYALDECQPKVSVLSALIPAELLENLIYIVWGVVSILLGSGFILALNEEQIISYFYMNPHLEQYAEFLHRVAQYVDGLVLNLIAVFDSVFNQALLLLDGYRYFFLIVFAVLATIQFFVYKMGKVQA